LTTTDFQPDEHDAAPRRKFDLSPQEALAEMRDILAGMREEENRTQLKDIDADTAFELGYETAIHDYILLTGPNPLQTGVIVYEKQGDLDA